MLAMGAKFSKRNQPLVFARIGRNFNFAVNAKGCDYHSKGEMYILFMIFSVVHPIKATLNLLQTIQYLALVYLMDFSYTFVPSLSFFHSELAFVSWIDLPTSSAWTIFSHGGISVFCIGFSVIKSPIFHFMSQLVIMACCVCAQASF